MTLQEIQEVYQSKIRAATNKFIGERVNKDLVDEVRKAVSKAALEAYEYVPMVYRDEYELPIPKVDITINGPEIQVQWIQGRP